MKLSKFANLVKNGGRCAVLHVAGSGIWLSTGTAIYRATELPDMEGSEQVRTVLDMTADAWKKVYLTEDWPESVSNVLGLNLAPYAQGEQDTEKLKVAAAPNGLWCSACRCKVDGELIFYNEAYLAPLAEEIKKSEYIYYTARQTEAGQRYLVVHDGMDVLAAIMPMNILKEEYINDDKDGNRLTLEQECINSGRLPSIAYGHKKCSLKHKIGTQEKFCNNYQPCKEVWASGQRVHKYIGYDAGETRRIQHAAPIDEADKKYEKHYPLYEWGWTREECVHVIERAGLPRPGKSSCFFCPSMKKKEIQALWENYPDLFERAIALEHGSAERNVNVKGLGRDWSWESYYNEFMANKEFEEAQLTFDQLFPDSPGGCICGAPCGCYDG